MREMTAEKQQLMDFDLLISSEKTHYESDLTIYYVLSGRMQVEMEKRFWIWRSRIF